MVARARQLSCPISLCGSESWPAWLRSPHATRHPAWCAQSTIWLPRRAWPSCAAGGNAADAAVATSAVLAVTTPHMCGMGGDLFALVYEAGEPPAALNASGRAGSGADPERLRAEESPHHAGGRGHPVRSRAGLRRRLAGPPRPLRPAPTWRRCWRAPGATPMRGSRPRRTWSRRRTRFAASRVPAICAAARHPGAMVRRPGMARALDAIVTDGRDGFYGGEFGAGLLELGGGEYLPADLTAVAADWVVPLSVEAWGARLWTPPPNSQGYLTLAAGVDRLRSALARRPRRSEVGTPDDRSRPLRRLRPGGRAARGDRRTRRCSRRSGWRAAATPSRPTGPTHLGGRYGAGDTVHLAAVDRDRMAVSLIQSNASGFGALIVEPTTGIFLHNRGLGFTLEPDIRPSTAPIGAHRTPCRRPWSPGRTGPFGWCSAPWAATASRRSSSSWRRRLLGAGESAGDAIAAGRWALSDRQGRGGFATWADRGEVQVELEALTPPGWFRGLEVRGHRVERREVLASGFGHAHVIVNHGDHLEGASDPRARAGAVTGY